jgi:hypothetical protein
VKFANLRANPHVVMVAGGNRWDQGLDVVVEGSAVQVTDDAVLARVAPRFAAKWDGRWKFAAVVPHDAAGLHHERTRTRRGPGGDHAMGFRGPR